MLTEHRPKAFFTQPRLQSPTTSVTPVAQLFRVLQLAGQHDVTLVENDLYVDLDNERRPSLASLDQLQRATYIGSCSKRSRRTSASATSWRTAACWTTSRS